MILIESKGSFNFWWKYVLEVINDNKFRINISLENIFFH